MLTIYARTYVCSSGLQNRARDSGRWTLGHGPCLDVIGRLRLETSKGSIIRGTLQRNAALHGGEHSRVDNEELPGTAAVIENLQQQRCLNR